MLETLDDAATRATARYSAFLASLRGVFSDSTGSAPRDMRAVLELRQSASAVAQTYLDTEHDLYRQDLYDVQQQAETACHYDILDAAGDATPWDSSGEAMADWYIHELGAQVWRDINTLVHARTRSAMAGTFTDRRGRVYQSDQHIRQTARHGLVLFGVQAYLLSAHALGAQEVTVTHPEPDHKHNGMRLALEEVPDVLTEVFHPNSRAFLRAEAA